MIKKEILKILACPECRTDLIPYEEFLVCINAVCRRQYPVKANFPMLIVETSEILGSDLHQQRILH